ncbi:MarR family winged helix-turn-helix transcriptional regulator [Rubrivivax rivuli]|uniref:MarR family transcriptional regulator n=1 Tax=Rubrivivax rivuli TaxID=1862385 RepID=A0A437RRJ6_9BURK|nr:MarR family transcriptional regulator [Rubrivivax rivuli]RVU49399.1 MarR family transcriptional regulator [Rubrivivax rivuli]
MNRAPKSAPARVPRKRASIAEEDRNAEAVRSWLSVVQAYHLCDALMTRRLAELGVRVPEHEILANLRREPGITQQVLASRCFSAKSHISALLTLLEGRGWVRREPDPSDARAKRLFLAAEGERIAAQTAAVQTAVVAAMVDGETDTALQAVTEAMKRVATRLKAQLEA